MRWPVPGTSGCRCTPARARRSQSPRRLHQVHLADLLVERAAVELDAERVLLDRAGLVVAQALASTSPCRGRGSRGSSRPRQRPRGRVMRRSVSAKPSRARRCSVGPTNSSGSSCDGRRAGPGAARPASRARTCTTASCLPSSPLRTHHPLLERAELVAHRDQLRIVGRALLQLGLAIEQAARSPAPPCARHPATAPRTPEPPRALRCRLRALRLRRACA